MRGRDLALLLLVGATLKLLLVPACTPIEEGTPSGCVDLLIHDETLVVDPEEAVTGTDLVFTWETGWTLNQDSGLGQPPGLQDSDDVIEELSVLRAADGGLEHVAGSPLERTVNRLPEDHEERSVRLFDILGDEATLQPGEYTFRVRSDLDAGDCPACQCPFFGHGLEEREFTVLDCPCNHVALSQDLVISDLEIEPSDVIDEGESFTVAWQSRYAGELCPTIGHVSTGVLTEEITMVDTVSGQPLFSPTTRDADALILGAPADSRSWASEDLEVDTPPPGTYLITIRLDPAPGTVAQCNDESGNDEAEVTLTIQ